MMRAAVFFVSLGLGAIALAGAGFAQDPELPDGPGKEKLMTVCTACHGITEVTNHRRPKEQWAETVDLMIARGAELSTEDYPAVVEYLSSHFAPVAAGSAAPAPAGAAASAPTAAAAPATNQ
jgi:mono/diheme cytochrome c family protein